MIDAEDRSHVSPTPSAGKVLRVGRRMFLGLLTGLVTGLLVGLALEVSYRIGDQAFADNIEGMLSAQETLITFLVMSGLAAVLATLGSRNRTLLRRLIAVAYLTTCIPLFGLAIADGTNVGVLMVGGTIGGTLWGLALLLSPAP